MLLDRHNKWIPGPRDLWDSMSKKEGISLKHTCYLIRCFSSYRYCQTQLWPSPSNAHHSFLPGDIFFLSFIENWVLYFSTNVDIWNNYRHSNSVVYKNRHRSLWLSFNISKNLMEVLLFPIMRMNGLTIQFLYFEWNYIDWMILSQVLDHMKL